MYSTKIFTQVVECQKALFDNSFAIMSTLQDQGHQVMDQTFEKSPLMSADSKKLCFYWVDFIKQNRKSCKEYVDSSFERIKELLIEPKPIPSPVETLKKPEQNTTIGTGKKPEQNTTVETGKKPEKNITAKTGKKSE